mgnify:CR=1 FL=1
MRKGLCLSYRDARQPEEARRQPPQRVVHTLCQIPACLAEHLSALVAEATPRPGLRNPNLRTGTFASFTQGPPQGVPVKSPSRQAANIACQSGLHPAEFRRPRENDDVARLPGLNHKPAPTIVAVHRTNRALTDTDFWRNGENIHLFGTDRPT